MTKHHDKKQLREGRLYLALSARLEFITIGKSRQDLQMTSQPHHTHRQEERKINMPMYLRFACSLFIHSYTAQDPLPRE